MADPTLIHGSRTERLFEATVLSLGHFRLLKTEDVGRVHAAVSCRAPDFRIVLDDGEQWLVEVKNVRSPEPFKQKTQMSAAYLASLQTYADMVGAPLKLAIFWSLWNIWTVISPERFRSPNGGLRITMKDAVLANESGRLGEVIIMTKAPLRVVLGAATDMPHSLSPEGLTNFIIGSAKLYSGEVELTDLRDRKLAEVRLFYGEWSVEGPLAITEGGEFAVPLISPRVRWLLAGGQAGVGAPQGLSHRAQPGLHLCLNAAAERAFVQNRPGIGGRAVDGVGGLCHRALAGPLRPAGPW